MIADSLCKLVQSLFLQWFANWWVPSCFVSFFSIPFFSWSELWPVDCGLSMWGKITIPMYRLWLLGLYGLYGPRCPLSPERPLNLITHSLPSVRLAHWFIYDGLMPTRRKPITWTNVDHVHPSALMREYWLRLIKIFQRCFSSWDFIIPEVLYF